MPKSSAGLCKCNWYCEDHWNNYTAIELFPKFKETNPKTRRYLCDSWFLHIPTYCLSLYLHLQRLRHYNNQSSKLTRLHTHTRTHAHTHTRTQTNEQTNKKITSWSRPFSRTRAWPPSNGRRVNNYPKNGQGLLRHLLYRHLHLHCQIGISTRFLPVIQPQENCLRLFRQRFHRAMLLSKRQNKARRAIQDRMTM